MVHINDFVEWVIKYNKSIQFKHTDQNIKDYSNLIIKHCKSPLYFHYLDVIEPYFNPILYKKHAKTRTNRTILGKTKKNKNGFEKSTLRMTINEMGD